MLFKNIRFYSLIFSLSLSVVIYLFIQNQYTSQRTQTIRLTQYYALAAVTYLYLALLIGPLLYAFPSLPFKNHVLKARRAIGVSAFYFAILHSSIAFFFQLGGFWGLFFLTSKYILAISLSFTALVILACMAATSFDKLIVKIKFKRWKLLHRLVYLAAFFILIHVLMLGTHFADLSGTIPQLFSIGLFFLLILESTRIDQFISQKFHGTPRLGVTTTFVIIIFVGYFYLLIYSSNTPISLGIHASHIELAKQAQQNQSAPQLPGLNGDRTKRYSVNFIPPTSIQPQQPTPLNFTVYDASTGDQVVSFNKVYEKFVHLIIVNEDLSFFDHVHPEPSGDHFTITYSFPKSDKYRLYIDFQPTGAIEQQFAFGVKVGDAIASSLQTNPNLALERTKVFNQYKVNLEFNSPLKSSLISIGSQKLTFTLSDKYSNQPLTNLKPYLEAFGHLVMINTQTYDYIHVHPTNTTSPTPDQTSGPIVEFMPLGIYGPIKAGTYKLFAQFNPDGKLFTSDFIVQVE